MGTGLETSAVVLNESAWTCVGALQIFSNRTYLVINLQTIGSFFYLCSNEHIFKQFINNQNHVSHSSQMLKIIQTCTILTWNFNLRYFSFLQTLRPSKLQNFIVDRVVCSPESDLIALAGSRGLTILELPRRWGPNGQYLEGKEHIICRYVNI